MANVTAATLAKISKSINEPTPVVCEELLDWDCAFETPPPAARSGRIEVTLRKVESGPSPL